MRANVADDIRSIFTSLDLASAQARLMLPTAHHHRMRTSNVIE
jgi:hypothetical protein